jgi:hypothetical protein
MKNLTSPASEKTIISRLSKDARILLGEASSDDMGNILFHRYIGGTSIMTNGEEIITDVGDPREVAKWESALNELKKANLIYDFTHKGQDFKVSDLGYKVADKIKIG